MEIASGKDPVAQIFLSSSRFEFFRIKMLSERFFIINQKSFKGLFIIDDSKVKMYKKIPVYMYDWRSAKPLDVLMCDELVHFAQKNKLHKITRSDVKHGNILRRLFKRSANKDEALEHAKVETQRTQENINKTITEFWDSVEAGKKEAAEKKKPYELQEPADYTYALTSHLYSKGLIDENEMMLINERVKSNTINFGQLIEFLLQKEVLMVHEPLSEKAELFLEDYHTFNPASVLSVSDKISKLDKALPKMTSIPVKNWIPATLVIAICVGAFILIFGFIQNFPMIQDMIKHGLGAKFLLGLKTFLVNRFAS